MELTHRFLEEVGPLAGSAIDVVDLDSFLDAEPPWIGLPCVVVGVARRAVVAPPALDVLLCDETGPPPPFVGCPDGVAKTLARLAAAVERAPLAAVTLVQLLRLGDGLDVERALLAESLAYAVLQAGPEHSRWLTSLQRHCPPPGHGMPVRIERTNEQLDIVLNRPNKRNAVNVRVRDLLVEALTVAVEDQSIRQIHLRGAGPAFCAGGDLAEFGTKPDPVTGHVVRTTRSVPALLDACRDRLVAHVHGACVGAGVEMAASAHRIIASADAWFALPELEYGLIPGAGGTVTIPRRIGRHRTAYLALTGERVDATLAQIWGLVDQLN